VGSGKRQVTLQLGVFVQYEILAHFEASISCLLALHRLNLLLGYAMLADPNQSAGVVAGRGRRYDVAGTNFLA